VVTEVDVYQEIRRLQLEGVVSKREAARRLGISRNTVKKYWDGDVVPWDKKPYVREANVITAEIRKFTET
jgi:DNA invertase Pin-like site-specific DNA recombinase